MFWWGRGWRRCPCARASSARARATATAALEETNRPCSRIHVPGNTTKRTTATRSATTAPGACHIAACIAPCPSVRARGEAYRSVACVRGLFLSCVRVSPPPNPPSARARLDRDFGQWFVIMARDGRVSGRDPARGTRERERGAQKVGLLLFSLARGAIETNKKQCAEALIMKMREAACCVRMRAGVFGEAV